jgi:acyl phosphate:glycerol-3-phosphate acyltransferase
VKAARRLAASASVLSASFLAGSIPFSQLAARHFAGADLRHLGSGTVSGTALYEVAGFGPLAIAGVLEVGKGAVGPLLARRAVGGTSRPRTSGDRQDAAILGALAAGAAIAGHDWSPWLGGAGGRGLSPALGATLVLAPEGAVVLAGSMAAGRLAHQSGLATFLAALSLIPLLAARRRVAGVALALSICVPMTVKRLLGNSAPRPSSESGIGPASLGAHLRSRLLFDRELDPRRHRPATAD